MSGADASRPEPPPEVVAFYGRGLEEQRLDEGKGKLERWRTQELLARYLPPQPAVVLDVGGGTGHYSVWLAQRGYSVHLIDPVPLHVEQARARSAAQPDTPLASIAQGDARRLHWGAGQVDAVLLLGPLYHLTTREERLDCLREAWRVLRPGGTLIAVVISRFASTLDGLVNHLFADPRYAPIAWQDLRNGQHRGLDGKYFTTAYLHHPAELEPELFEAGFRDMRVLAIEGPGWLLQDFQAQWADANLRETILEVVRRTEAEPSLLGASSHLMAIGRKPSDARPSSGGDGRALVVGHDPSDLETSGAPGPPPSVATDASDGAVRPRVSAWRGNAAITHLGVRWRSR
jgi:ubiquinone/menaquinone biosynthesis C-methylase UbiE